MYDRPLTRKTLVKFNPESVLNLMCSKAEHDNEEDGEDREQEEREKVVDDYLEV